MKYWIKKACGHEERVDLFGSSGERERKIAYLESQVCKECYEKEKYTDCDEVKMTYTEYKRNYANCKTKADSYDNKNKTIVVYVPKTPPEEKPETDSLEGRKAAIKKVAEETELPYEALEKIFMVFDAEQYLKQTEAHADTLKASPDKTNKHKNAYIAAVNLGKTAQKYGL
jgi:adenylosuccinate synthase